MIMDSCADSNIEAFFFIYVELIYVMPWYTRGRCNKLPPIVTIPLISRSIFKKMPIKQLKGVKQIELNYIYDDEHQH